MARLFTVLLTLVSTYLALCFGTEAQRDDSFAWEIGNNGCPDANVCNMACHAVGGSLGQCSGEGMLTCRCK
ncbi:hypothetical protein MTO96_040952 [Rhipicephalus appendiculatus]